MEKTVSICAANFVQSHILTLDALGRGLEQTGLPADFVLLDIVGFKSWDASEIPFPRAHKRISITPDKCEIEAEFSTHRDWVKLNKHLRDLMQTLQPDLFVAMADKDYINWALFRAADAVGTPSLLIQEGPYRHDWIVKPFNIIFRTLARRWKNTLTKRSRQAPVIPGYGSGCKGHIAALSDFYKTLYIRAGVEKKRVKVTGNPRFDSLVQIANNRKAEPKDKRERPIKILVISQPLITYGVLDAGSTVNLYKILADGLELLQGEAVCHLRFHPSESDSEQRIKLELLEGTATSTDEVSDFYDCLGRYDLCLGFFSTALLEAAISGIPAICIQNDAICQQVGHIKQAGLPVAISSEQLANLCRQYAFTQPKLSNVYLDKEMGKLDGKASIRTAEICASLIEARIIV